MKLDTEMVWGWEHSCTLTIADAIEPVERVGSVVGRTSRRCETIHGREIGICQLDTISYEFETVIQATPNEGE